MKKITFLLLLFLSKSLLSQNLVIPDINFKNALLEHGNSITSPIIWKIDTNNDGEIQMSEAIAYEGSINVENKNITDLTGIEAFENIRYLFCYSNELTSLDVSHNTKLITLYCQYNQLTTIDVTQNNLLKYFYCGHNRFSNLDISQNIQLESFACWNNQIDNLDVTQNILLQFFHCDENAISNLDVTQNTNLTYLSCNGNLLTTLNITNNTRLLEIHCGRNDLNTLDISQNQDLTDLSCNQNNLLALNLNNNPNLVFLNCHRNDLINLDLSSNLNLSKLYCGENNLTSLELTQNQNLTEIYCFGNNLTVLNVANGNNTSIAEFSAINNPSLTCIQIDAGFVPVNNWLKDNSASFSENCTLTTKDFIWNESVFCYPNPTYEKLTVGLKRNQKIDKLVLTTLEGRVISTIKNTTEMNLESVVAGVYLLRVATEEGKIYTQKIIKK